MGFFGGEGDVEGLGFCCGSVTCLDGTGLEPMVRLTWIRDVVAGIGKDFEWAGEVEKAHLVVEGEEDLDVLGGIAAFINCTHRD